MSWIHDPQVPAVCNGKERRPTQKRHIISLFFVFLITKQTQFHGKLLFVNNKQPDASGVWMRLKK